MCGIAGIILQDKTDLDLLANIRQMADSMSHRGPDDQGCVILDYDDKKAANQIAFGHRRLKIIDLTSGGHQPMFSHDKELCITYNGEVYNYVELRDELSKKGYKFQTSSDTEIILKSYEEWGVDCFQKFNGMWAIAIFDRPNKKIVLSRDRFGVKPLYYYRTESVFIFASEIKAILKSPFVKKEPNFDKIFRYIAFNYRYVDIDNSSFFENIHQVPKSTYLEIDAHLNSKETRYWQLRPSYSHERQDNESVIEFRDLLIDSIKLRLRSDVPIGCMLSGGMDSTSIACIAYKIFDKPIVTFSGITGEQEGVYDESRYINSVIKEINANFHYIRPDPADIFTTVDEMLAYHDEPICTVTWYSLFLIAKKVGREKIPVILNGHAGDELLAGYWDHYQYNFYDLFEEGNMRDLLYEIDMWGKNHNRKISEIENTSRFISVMKKDRGLEITKFKDYSNLFNDEVSRRYKKTIILNSSFSGELSRRLDIELMQDGVPTVLRPEDRNTMSQSLESRSPFLDYRLAEFCFSLPNRLKIRNGIGKWILREAMKGILPEDVRTRKDKSGFIAPADEWFRTINKKQLADLINSPAFEKRNLFNVPKVNELFAEHIEKRANHQMVLWQIINLELWFKRFFDA